MTSNLTVFTNHYLNPITASPFTCSFNDYNHCFLNLTEEECKSRLQYNPLYDYGYYIHSKPSDSMCSLFISNPSSEDERYIMNNIRPLPPTSSPEDVSNVYFKQDRITMPIINNQNVSTLVYVGMAVGVSIPTEPKRNMVVDISLPKPIRFSTVDSTLFKIVQRYSQWSITAKPLRYGEYFTLSIPYSTLTMDTNNDIQWKPTEQPIVDKIGMICCVPLVSGTGHMFVEIGDTVLLQTEYGMWLYLDTTSDGDERLTINVNKASHFILY